MLSELHSSARQQDTAMTAAKGCDARHTPKSAGRNHLPLSEAS